MPFSNRFEVLRAVKDLKSCGIFLNVKLKDAKNASGSTVENRAAKLDGDPDQYVTLATKE